MIRGDQRRVVGGEEDAVVSGWIVGVAVVVRPRREVGEEDPVEGGRRSQSCAVRAQYSGVPISTRRSLSWAQTP